MCRVQKVIDAHCAKVAVYNESFYMEGHYQSYEGMSPRTELGGGGSAIVDSQVFICDISGLL